MQKIVVGAGLLGGLLGRDGGGGGVQTRRVPHGRAQHGKRKGLQRERNRTTVMGKQMGCIYSIK